MAGVLVIGGASGLGGVIACAFAQHGNRVLLIDEFGGETERGETASGETASGLDIEFVHLDLGTEEAGRRAVQEAAARLAAIDTLVVAAAQMESAPIGEWTASMWDRAAAINLRLPFLVTQAAAPWLARSDNASVTFVSSTATMRGQPFTHAYQATKAGLAGLVRSLAAELGPEGVRVNAVLAGWLDTPLTRAYWEGVEDVETERARIDGRIPLRRHGNAEEAAGLVRFLASPAAGYVTGAMLPVDGGDTAV